MAQVKAESKKQKAKVRGNPLLLFAFCFLLWSCAERDAHEKVEFWGLGREGEVVASMLPEFERRNPGLHVVVQQIPWSAAHEKLLTAFVGEAAPDVAQMGNTWIPEFASMNALEPIDARIVEQRDYFPGVWEIGRASCRERV